MGEDLLELIDNQQQPAIFGWAGTFRESRSGTASMTSSQILCRFPQLSIPRREERRNFPRDKAFTSLHGHFADEIHKVSKV